MRLTEALLRSCGACEEQVVIFAAEWPNGCQVTEATLLRAVELGLNIRSPALELLAAPLLAEFKRQEDRLREEYEHQRALLREEFRRQMVLLIASIIAQGEAVVEARD